MNLSPEKSNAQCLVYRKSPRTWSGSAVTILGSILGLALMAFGLLAIEGSDKFMNLWVSGVGFIIFVNSLILGIWMMSDRRLVLDKSSQQLVTSWSVLKLRNSTTQPLSDFIAVRCERKKRAREGASSWVYPVKLQASAPHRSRIIFEESDPARAWQLTTEIGEFLGISQEYWQMTREPGPSEIEVDSSPVNCGAASWCDSQMRSDEHRLVIEPNRGYFRVAWGALAFGGLLIAAAVLAANEPEPGRWGRFGGVRDPGRRGGDDRAAEAVRVRPGGRGVMDAAGPEVPDPAAVRSPGRPGYQRGNAQWFAWHGVADLPIESRPGRRTPGAGERLEPTGSGLGGLDRGSVGRFSGCASARPVSRRAIDGRSRLTNRKSKAASAGSDLIHEPADAFRFSFSRSVAVPAAPTLRPGRPRSRNQKASAGLCLSRGRHVLVDRGVAETTCCPGLPRE